MEAPWLTDRSEIPTASIESLKRSLLTSDGRGSAFKATCLEELIRRALLTSEVEVIGVKSGSTRQIRSLDTGNLGC